jgi:isoleucyl-tRNA synthetase
MPYNAQEQELEVLKQWDKTDAFRKSVENRPLEKQYAFYDGPPFATGLPHYGHLMAGTKKDVVPRYFAMQGFRVERRWGWDCHGLPIENLIEKELGLSGKQEIEKYGVAKFNEACRSKVLEYADEWKKIIPRMGRWVDMDNPYKTMDVSFMESVWWVFAELYKKGLIYEGKRPMHVCPRCVTPLSNFEVSQGYKDIKDISVIARFKITGGTSPYLSQAQKMDSLYFLAWTTTPWTLPGNVLLAVGEKIEYGVVKFENEYYVAAKDRINDVFEGKVFEVVDSIKGSDLVGLVYEPLFPYFKDSENSFRVIAAEFVSTEEGSGIVHIAPAFGTDDYEVFRKENVPFIQHVNMDGTFIKEVVDFVGMHVKPINDHTATDVEIIKWLAHNGKLFSKKKYEHSYPHCWRCDTPLLNYATNSWFVEVTKIQKELIENNQKINWVPEHIKDGRFGKWLESVKDWSISRNRFWGTPLPVWKSDDGEVVCIGSVAELEELTGKKITDIHKHKIDDLLITKNGKEFKRIPDVLDTWFDSGAVPYGQKHYPFENKAEFEATFPADFIAESQDQTRGWFYTLHVLATALTTKENPSIPVKKGTAAFKNVSVNGIILAEDGKKMSKRLNNYPDPMHMVEKYGADALRYYLLTSPVMMGENLNFSETGVREIYNKLINTLWNVCEFYELFAEKGKVQKEKGKRENILDTWIITKLNILVKEVTEGMEAYKLAEASRPIVEFVTELSQWYVRRSRDRFKGEDEGDKEVALATLHTVLLTLSKVMAPFTPFIAETLYQKVGGEMESVHLEDFPVYNKKEVDENILGEMEHVRKVVEMGLALRAQVGIKVRQTLSQLFFNGITLSDAAGQIVADEMNVKSVTGEVNKPTEFVIIKEDNGIQVGLDTEMTDELKIEGLVRETVRAINQIRKESGLTVEDRVVIYWYTEDAQFRAVFESYKDTVAQSVLATELIEKQTDTRVTVEGVEISLTIEKK